MMFCSCETAGEQGVSVKEREEEGWITLYDRGFMTRYGEEQLRRIFYYVLLLLGSLEFSLAAMVRFARNHRGPKRGVVESRL